VNDSWIRHPVWRTTLYVVGFAVIVALQARYAHHQNPSGASTEGDRLAAPASASPVQPQAPAPAHVSTSQILAGCHPHLTLTPASVPNIDVSNKPNPSAIQLKVRFWVNSDGFVTQAIVTGAIALSRADQEDALDYVRGLTFEVPNTEECRVRQMEMIGRFRESLELDSSGEWATVFEVTPQ